MTPSRATVACYAGSLVLAAVASLAGFGIQQALQCAGDWKSWAEPCRLGPLDITMTMFSMQLLGTLCLVFAAVPLGGFLFIFASIERNCG